MTERKPLQYFDRESLETVHDIVAKSWKQDGEPIPPFSTANEGNIDALVKIPQSSYFGVELYPTLESKAAIIFYTLNKKHLFTNGNKRMSVACLVIFLIINGKFLKAEPEDLTKIALDLAKTTHEHDFDEIKRWLEEWIAERVTDLTAYL